MGATIPRFAHLPLILGEDRAPLSKRHGATAVRAYREDGYLPDALMNFLARLGWAHGDQEIFSWQELAEKFKLEDVGKSAGVFNSGKMQWLNAHYLNERDPHKLAQEVKPFLPQNEALLPDDNWLARMVTTLQPRAKTLVELGEQSAFYLSDSITPEEKAAKKFLKESSLSLLSRLRERLGGLAAWDEPVLHGAFSALMEDEQVKLGKIAQPVRVALTGKTASPGIFEVMEVLGKERCLTRIDRVLTEPSVASES